ncbi:HAMP domain-containing protein [Candidatus Bipolaricaulota bacterium]|nr:HAMP domain-containing protein [Candidatus Bipolaricaulota bacterium]
MWSYLRRHLGWKIFISYLIVILVGIIILATAAEFVVPRAFDRHMAAMSSMMMGMMGNIPTGVDLDADLFNNFRAAVTEALTLAGIAATLAAVAVSVFVSRQVVAPVRAMMVASHHIANGHYDERVQVPGDPAKGELDELAQLALSFNQMAEKLAQTEDMRRQLIGDVAHELRTPLTTIKGYMEGLIDGVLPVETETFQQVHHEADRLQRLVYDLQELSRVEAGAYELNLQPVQVSTLMADVTARLSRQFEEKEVVLETDIPSSLPRVLADKDRIDQVLTNVVGNALQYTPAGGRVWVTATLQGKKIFIAVHDTGIGISPEHLPNLFTRFYRVEKSRSRAVGGSGIGLTIAKYLVEAHGGRIWAENAPDGGACFTFTLPVSTS